MTKSFKIDYKSTIRVPEEGLPILSSKPLSDFIEPDGMEKVSKILISDHAIRERVAGLGEQIAAHFATKKNVVMLVVLKGAFVFAADLGRAIYLAHGPSVRFDFVRASTYGDEIKKNGEVERRCKIEAMTADVSGKDVLLVEDIVDQGFTLLHLKRYLKNECLARSVTICALLEKELASPTPEVKANRESLRIDFTGFIIPDLWIAGYGIDAGEYFRYVPSIVAVDEDYFRWNA